MKRKYVSIAAIAAALIASLSFSTQALAVSRTTTTEIVGITFGGNVAEGEQVLGARREGTLGEDLSIGSIKVPDAVNKLKDTELVTSLVSAATGTTVKAENVTVLDSFDVSPAPGIVVSKENPVSITFSFPGITESSKAYVLHYENGNWVVVPTTVGNGVVTGTFTSLSPVALVAEKDTLKSAVLGANRAVSPRTGEDDNVFIMTVIAGCFAVLMIMGVIDKVLKTK